MYSSRMSSENPYHNFRHAFCVTQMVYSILSTLSKETEITIDSWGVLIIAAIAHDVGTRNATKLFSSGQLLIKRDSFRLGLDLFQYKLLRIFDPKYNRHETVTVFFEHT